MCLLQRDKTRETIITLKLTAVMYEEIASHVRSGFKTLDCNNPPIRRLIQLQCTISNAHPVFQTLVNKESRGRHR